MIKRKNNEPEWIHERDKEIAMEQLDYREIPIQECLKHHYDETYINPRRLLS